METNNRLAYLKTEISPSEVPAFIAHPVFTTGQCNYCGGKHGNRKPMAKRSYDVGSLTLCRVCAMEDHVISGGLKVPLIAVNRYFNKPDVMATTDHLQLFR